LAVDNELKEKIISYCQDAHLCNRTCACRFCVMLLTTTSNRLRFWWIKYR